MSLPIVYSREEAFGPFYFLMRGLDEETHCCLFPTGPWTSMTQTFMWGLFWLTPKECNSHSHATDMIKKPADRASKSKIPTFNFTLIIESKHKRNNDAMVQVLTNGTSELQFE